MRSALSSAGRASAMSIAIIGAAAIFGLMPTSSVRAQGISDKAITIMVPFSPGSGLDFMARFIGEKLSKEWNQTVVINNVTGASGSIGTRMVARSEPDGQTILFTATSYALNAVFTKDLPYDPLKDFRSIIEVARATWSLAVTPKFPAKNVKEFVAYAKANPGKISYATPGMATPHFVSMELLKKQAKLDMLHVPYKGQAHAVTDVVAGHVPVMVFPTHVALPLAQQNKLRMLGVFADKRVDLAPDMPTMTEEGFPVSIDVWYGFLAPAKTPNNIVDKYNAAIGKIIASPEVKEVFAKRGLAVTGGTPAEFDKLIKRQITEWREVVKEANIPTR